MTFNELFKNACRIHTDLMINRYLMACTTGRADGAEKALMHLELSYFYAAVLNGYTPDQARVRHHSVCRAIHDATQVLTDNLDTEIDFPLFGRPDYDVLVPKFFEKFHTLAMQVD